MLLLSLESWAGGRQVCQPFRGWGQREEGSPSPLGWTSSCQSWREASEMLLPRLWRPGRETKSQVPQRLCGAAVGKVEVQCQRTVGLIDGGLSWADGGLRWAVGWWFPFYWAPSTEVALAFYIRCFYPHTNPPSGGIYLLWASPFYRWRNKAIQPVSSEFTNSSNLCHVCPWLTDALSIFFPATSTHFHAEAQPWTCSRSCLPNALSLHPTNHLGGSPWLPRPPSLLYSEDLPCRCASRCQIIDVIVSFPL